MLTVSSTKVVETVGEILLTSVLESIPGIGQNQNNYSQNQRNDSDSVEENQNHFLRF